MEVQRSPQPNFFRRCVYYSSRIYSLGSRKGDDQRYDLLPVYLIALLDRDFGFDRPVPDWVDKYVSSYTFREMTTGQVEDDTISLILVELNRFRKTMFKECRTVVEEWCWMLKKMEGLRPTQEELRSVYHEFEDLLDAARISGFNKEKRAKYDADMITERDYYNILETVKKEGMDEGKAEAAMQIARKLLASGMPGEKVADITGLTAGQMADLKIKV